MALGLGPSTRNCIEKFWGHCTGTSDTLDGDIWCLWASDFERKIQWRNFGATAVDIMSALVGAARDSDLRTLGPKVKIASCPHQASHDAHYGGPKISQWNFGWKVPKPELSDVSPRMRLRRPPPRAGAGCAGAVVRYIPMVTVRMTMQVTRLAPNAGHCLPRTSCRMPRIKCPALFCRCICLGGNCVDPLRS